MFKICSLKNEFDSVLSSIVDSHSRPITNVFDI